MVLSKYFFLLVPFVAFILFPRTRYFLSFWGPLGVILVRFGSILVALGSSTLGISPLALGPRYGNAKQKNMQNLKKSYQNIAKIVFFVSWPNF